MAQYSDTPTLKLRTDLPVSPAPFTVCPAGEPAVLLGSCFATNIGERLERAMWPVCVNPCGVQYNPVSINQLMSLAISREDPELYSPDGEHWLSFNFTTHFTRTDRTEALSAMNEALGRLRSALREASVLIVTLGTAYVYYRADNSEPVANCHKLPADFFTRRRLTVSETEDTLRKMLTGLAAFNPTLKVIFTVSPVRHTKDGMHANTLSKSTLMLAVDNVVNAPDLPLQCTYFPAYELVCDDLRDYRFYADDLVHPSAQAVDYIWQHFLASFTTPDTRRAVAEAERLSRRLAHRPINPDLTQHKI